MKAHYEMKKAACVGAVCIATYAVGYFFRSILSVYTPQMLASTLFTKEGIALLSSVYMISYAAGQLVNGVLGDYIKSKYMVLMGMLTGGSGLLLFAFVSPGILQAMCFFLVGFGLSMLRGPLVKIISENSLPRYARISCSLLSMSPSLGALTASVASLFIRWDRVFAAAGITAYIAAALSFVLLTVLEKRGMIVQLTGPRDKGHRLDILGVFRLPDFVRVFFLMLITEVTSTAIGFWIPTYLAERLQFPETAASMVYSGMSVAKVFTPVLCLILLKFFHENWLRMMGSMFMAAAALTLAMIPVGAAWPNALLFAVSTVAAGIASSVVWCVYIPGLAKSGKVSSANGVLDCMGYCGAASANMLFAVVITNWGWNAALAVWAAIFVAGVVITVLPGKGKKAGK